MWLDEPASGLQIYPESGEAALRATTLAASDEVHFDYKEVTAKLPRGVTVTQRIFSVDPNTPQQDVRRIEEWIQVGRGEMPLYI